MALKPAWAKGLDEHIQQGNELGVVEGLLMVIVEPVLDLAFTFIRL